MPTANATAAMPTAPDDERGPDECDDRERARMHAVSDSGPPWSTIPDEALRQEALRSAL